MIIRGAGKAGAVGGAGGLDGGLYIKGQNRVKLDAHVTLSLIRNTKGRTSPIILRDIIGDPTAPSRDKTTKLYGYDETSKI